MGVLQNQREHNIIGTKYEAMNPTAISEKKEVLRDVRNSKVRNKTSSGEIGLNIRTLPSPKVGQDQVSGGVSVLCWHATPVANVLWKPLAIR